MRVISGSARGRKLVGMDGLSTRPTTDMVKESIFNIIQFDIEGRTVLDLFAGTGQMGIEALSRGADRATFVEQKTDAVRIIKENLRLTGFADKSSVLQEDVASFLAKRPGKFDLIFLDPPYNTNLLKKTLQMIAEFDILSESGIIICETHTGYALPELAPPYGHMRDYKYGKTKISLFTRQEES